MKSHDDLIYDVGMHNGDDTAYYLAKGYRVVGIDANPELCAACERRFAQEIAGGRLLVLNVGIGLEPGWAEFFINNRETQISSFAAPANGQAEWDSIAIQLVRLSSVMRDHGVPHYAKIDVEHYDHLVLQDLMAHRIRPELISAESHTAETFRALRSMGYSGYQLVEGPKVSDLYGAHQIALRAGGQLAYAFPALSSGPFGEDLSGEWLSAEALEAELARIGLGWVDIHARA